MKLPHIMVKFYCCTSQLEIFAFTFGNNKPDGTAKIMGSQDYQMFYHTSSEGLVWLNRKGNPIPLSHLLDRHVEAIDPSELWNSIQTCNKAHKQNLTALGNGPTNSTTLDANAPIMTIPTSPIMEHHVEVRPPRGVLALSQSRNLLEDPHIQPGMMWSALGVVASLFTPNKLTLSAGSNDPVAANNVLVGSTPTNVETSDINRELSTYKDRLALELTNFKKQLETQSCIEVECAKTESQVRV